MPFQSLNQVLGAIEGQDRWQGNRQFQKLLTCWPEIVGPAVAAQTRPLSIGRQVLYVATSTAAWAQNLLFERHRILEKLNDRLEMQLTDIRFSTAQWRSKPISRPNEADEVWQLHPSRIEKALPPPAATSPQAAFSAWAEAIQSRSRHLPLCPQCRCPTPSGELKRWSMCALCAPKQWSNPSL